MQMAIDVAGFTPAEADQLRRAMGSKRVDGADGATARAGSTTAWPRNGITGDVADEIYEKIAGVRHLRLPRVALDVSFALPRLRQRPGSSCTTRRRSARRCSTPSRWASTRRSRWCTTRSGTASRCCAPTCRRPTCTRAWSGWVRRRQAGSRSWCRHRAAPAPDRAGGADRGRCAVARRPARARVRPVGGGGRRAAGGRRAPRARPVRRPAAAGPAGAAVDRHSSRPWPPRGRSTAWASRVGRRCGRRARSRRRDRTRSGGAPVVALVLAHRPREIVLTLVCDVRNVVATGQIQIVAAVAPILRDERRGTLHAIGVSRVSRWLWCRQFCYKVGKISEVIVGETRCHLGHDLDHRIVLLGRRGPLLFAEHIELYQQIGRRLPAE